MQKFAQIRTQDLQNLKRCLGRDCAPESLPLPLLGATGVVRRPIWPKPGWAEARCGQATTARPQPADYGRCSLYPWITGAHRLGLLNLTIFNTHTVMNDQEWRFPEQRTNLQ